MPTVTRTNLCTNPSFEAGLTGWSAAGGVAPTISQSTQHPVDRTKNLLITWGTAGFLPNAQTTVACVVGALYTASITVYVPAGNPAVNLVVAGVGFGANSTVFDAPQRISITWTATAATHTVGITPASAATTGQLCHADACLIEQTNVVAAYFDGASSGCQWTGTVDLSTSQQLSGPLSITVAADTVNEPPRYSIFVSGAPGATAQVNRTDPDGTIRPVRGGDPAPLTGTQWIGYDYEAPYNAQPIFTVVPSDGSPSVFVTAPLLSSTQSRLIHPGVPSLSMKINGTMRGSRDYPSGSAEHLVVGAKFPRVESDAARKSGKYPLILRTTTDAENTALTAVLAGCVPLLLQLVQPFTGAAVWQYISVDGVHEEEVTQVFGDPKRVWTLDVTVVDRPSGGVAAQRTWADLMAECATWQDVMNKYKTWAGVITGVPGT